MGIPNLNGANANGASANGMHAKTPKPRTSRTAPTPVPEPVPGQRLFVAGLPEAVQDDILRQLFEATGADVLEATVPRDRQTGRSRRFGFVTLGTIEQARAAREALDGSVQGGRSISVREFKEVPRSAGAGASAIPTFGAPTGVASNGLRVEYRVLVTLEDAPRVEHLLGAAREVGIVADWHETRLFSWSCVPDASARELRRAIGGEPIKSLAAEVVQPGEYEGADREGAEDEHDEDAHANTV